MFNLICLTGNIGVGKSTVADIIKKYGYTELTFAGPVKDIGLILGFDYNDVYGTQDDKLKINEYWGVSGREFMQKFATNIMCDELSNHIKMIMDGKTIWVKLCEKKIKDLLTQNKKILVSDGRFIDEINMIKELDGKIIKIIRNNNNYNNYNNHVSESYISQINADIIIDNTGTINELEDKIKQILQ